MDMDLPDGEVVRRAPVGVHAPQFVWLPGVGDSCDPSDEARRRYTVRRQVERCADGLPGDLADRSWHRVEKCRPPWPQRSVMNRTDHPFPIAAECCLGSS